MEWGGRTGCRISQRGDHNRCTAIRLYFSAHPKCSLALIDNSAVQAARKTCSRYNQIGFLDHKMTDICDFLAHTS